MATSELLYTVPEASREAGVSKGTMHNLWNRGLGPKVTRIGGRVFIAKKTLREWVLSLEVDAFPAKMAAVSDLAPAVSAQSELGPELSTASNDMTESTLAPPSRLNAHRPVSMHDLSGGRRRREPR